MRRSHALQTQGKDAAWLDKHMGCFQSSVHRGPTSEDPFFRPNEAALIDEPFPPRSWAPYKAARLRRFRALHGSGGDEGREQGSGDGSGGRASANGSGVKRSGRKNAGEASGAEEQGLAVVVEAASATAAAAAAGVLLLGGEGSKEEKKKTATKRGLQEASEGDETSAGKKRKASDDSGSSDSDSDSEGDGEH